ncbi:hypothetical protein CRG98_046260 [Punica granatum]|uniref:Uncharacterized protein n=1 Tax=Punica granatum TaxID=22663 RepID=A0A2I0HPE6_PUNGR|nr:hypothetical protein CRG98_046260 [Punica granatum]
MGFGAGQLVNAIWLSTSPLLGQQENEKEKNCHEGDGGAWGNGGGDGLVGNHPTIPPHPKTNLGQPATQIGGVVATSGIIIPPKPESHIPKSRLEGWWLPTPIGRVVVAGKAPPSPSTSNCFSFKFYKIMVVRDHDNAHHRLIGV